MSLIPSTVCRRCHREYPSIRSRCPYCGTKRPREVKRAVPESDSAVRGTAAAKRAGEDVNWQMLIGGILLLAIVAAVITIVSVNVGARVDDTATLANVSEVEPEATAIPTPTPTPTATPVPTPPVTSVVITLWGSETKGFAEDVGDEFDLDATAFPVNEDVEIEWSSSDDSIVSVDQDGVVKLLSSGYCQVFARAGGVEASIDIWVR